MMERRQAQTREARSLVFRKLKISYSRRCSAACDHCWIFADPQRTEVLNRETVLACIQGAAEFGLEIVEFSGGEPPSFVDDLLEFTSCAHGCGLRVIANTSASWATTHDLALRVLGELKQHGLIKMGLSTDRYHQQFVPLSHIVNAITAARELDITAIVTICHVPNDPTVLETVAALYRYTSDIQFQRVTPYGRGATLPREGMVSYPYSHACLPCKELVNPTVGPDGRVTLCSAPPLDWAPETAWASPLVLGWLDREPLVEILHRAQEDPFLNLLAAGGLAAIVNRINELEPDLYQPRPEGYSSLCGPCIEILGSEPFLTCVHTLMPAVTGRPSRDERTMNLQ